MKSIKNVALTVAVSFLLALPSTVFAAFTPEWSNATTNVSNSDFDTGELTFDRITGSCIAIVDEDNGYFHDHSDPRTFSLEVRLENVWTEVWSLTTTGDGVDRPLRSIPTQTYTEGLVDGVRLTVDVDVSQAYHNVPSDMRFEIRTDGECGRIPQVPSSSTVSLTILIAALMLVGLYQVRRRKVMI